MPVLKRPSVPWFWSLPNTDDHDRLGLCTEGRPKYHPGSYLDRKQETGYCECGWGELKQYLRQKGQLCLQEGVLYQCGSQARWNHNESQLVVLLKYGLKAMCGAHNDVGHLGLEKIINILHDWFYWPNLEANATHLWLVPEVWKWVG